MGDLSLEIFGKRLKNPVMNASGTLGYGVEIERLWDVGILGAFVTKGLSLLPYHGNSPPRIKEERGCLLNRIGLQNVGLERFWKEYLPFFKKKNLPVIINFFGFSEEDYVAFAEKVKEDPLILALEMNLSCPNIKEGGLAFGTNPKIVSRLVKKVKDVSPYPLIVKLSPFNLDLKEIVLSAIEAGADGFTLFNTIPCSSMENLEMFFYGLSGPTLRPITLKALYETSKFTSVPLFGCGGIVDTSDALSYFFAGARAIQIGTSTFIDPYTIPKVIEGLKAYVRREGSLEKLIGIAHEVR